LHNRGIALTELEVVALKSACRYFTYEDAMYLLGITGCIGFASGGGYGRRAVWTRRRSRSRWEGLSCACAVTPIRVL
jgi:hypothetical protein